MGFLGGVRDSKKTSPCPMCSGSGYLPQYDKIDRGICYTCGGAGQVSEAKRLSTESRREKDKKSWLNDIKAGLEFVRQNSVLTQDFFVKQENTNTYVGIARAYLNLMSYDPDFARRVKERIEANLTQRQRKDYEKVLAFETEQSSPRRR